MLCMCIYYISDMCTLASVVIFVCREVKDIECLLLVAADVCFSCHNAAALARHSLPSALSRPKDDLLESLQPPPTIKLEAATERHICRQ